MNKYHQKILNSLKENSPSNSKEHQWVNEKYHGNSHLYYGYKVPGKRKIAKDWVKENKDIGKEELLETVDSLIKGKSYEEKTIGAEILNSFPKHRKEMNINLLDEWLEHLEGWGEIDSLCQSSFTAKEVLDRWKEWEKLLKELNKSKFIEKRRASLVLLVKPCREIDDTRLQKLAFQNIDSVKSEKDILITKAISWLLREMVKQSKEKVVEYLEENQESLPKIAVRETRKKIKTGKKNSY